MNFPKLPAKAAYITINNPAKRNTLSLAILRDLRQQLRDKLTSPRTGELLTLPPFQPSILEKIEQGHPDYLWLTSAETWRELRQDLPNVLVLRSDGPVFSSGHDLKEIVQLSHDDVKETFRLCAEVMELIRHSPAPVVCRIQSMALAAGFQLAMTADYPIALANTKFRLPGASIGLPCTSPSTAISRRLGNGLTYRMLATADWMTAAEVNGQGTLDIVPVPTADSPDEANKALEERVDHVVNRLAVETAGQPLALGKWAYWTQVGMGGQGDGYVEAAQFAGRVMALHAKAEDAKEGMAAFIEKRDPVWKT